MASEHGHTSTVELLVQCDSSKKTLELAHESTGVTPLYVACERGFTWIVDLLIKAGANVDCERIDNHTKAIIIAANNEHKDVVTLLTKKLDELEAKQAMTVIPATVHPKTLPSSANGAQKQEPNRRGRARQMANRRCVLSRVRRCRFPGPVYSQPKFVS